MTGPAATVGKRCIRTMWASVGLALLGVLLTGCPEPTAKPPVEPPPPPPVSPTARHSQTFEYFPYHVRRGDTLSSLGRRFKVAWQELADSNYITKPDELAVGQLLIIPKEPGVKVPPLEAPQQAPPSTRSALRRSLRPAQLYHGKSSSRFWWPTAGRLIRAYGSPVRGLPGTGIAIAAPAGTEVYAVASGTVIMCVGTDRRGLSAWGRVVAVAHDGGYVSWYAHLDTVLVRRGQRVRKGHAIGTVGASGAAPEPQLAFRLYHNDRPVDPESVLP